MNNSPNNNNRQNLVNFLRENQPIIPQASPYLEQNIIDALEPHSTRKHRHYLELTQSCLKAIASNTPTRFIATGYIFTCVSFGFRTPRIAIEPKDLENFLVNNWQDTLNKRNTDIAEEAEAYLLLPTMAETQPTLSVSAP